MKLVFVLLVLLVFPVVSGLGVYPASLTFFAEQGEEICQEINVEIDEDIFVNDSWSENKSAENFGLDIHYEKFVNESGEFIFCLTGNQIGEFHGRLFFYDKEVDLDIFIEEKIVEIIETNNNGGGGGGGSGKIAVAVVVKNESLNESSGKENKLEELSANVSLGKENFENEAIGQTVSVPDQSQIKWFNLIPVVFIVFVIAMKVYVVRKKKDKTLSCKKRAASAYGNI